jgi:hypothetical protein
VRSHVGLNQWFLRSPQPDCGSILNSVVFGQAAGKTIKTNDCHNSG